LFENLVGASSSPEDGFRISLVGVGMFFEDLLGVLPVWLPSTRSALVRRWSVVSHPERMSSGEQERLGIIVLDA